MADFVFSVLTLPKQPLLSNPNSMALSHQKFLFESLTMVLIQSTTSQFNRIFTLVFQKFYVLQNHLVLQIEIPNEHQNWLQTNQIEPQDPIKLGILLKQVFENCLNVNQRKEEILIAIYKKNLKLIGLKPFIKNFVITIKVRAFFFNKTILKPKKNPAFYSTFSKQTKFNCNFRNFPIVVNF